MDIVNYIRTLADKLGEQNKPSTDYSDTEKKIAEITGGGSRGRVPADPEPVERKTYERVEYTPATDEEINEAIRLSCADEFVERIGGLDFKVEQGGANLSGGQRQRLCIARALLTSPKILVLADSTSAVDMNTDKAIRKAFKESIPDTTKLIIAQRIASVMDADKIIVMENGRIDGFGTHEELMESNEIYREVYTSQVEAGGDFDESAGN